MNPFIYKESLCSAVDQLIYLLHHHLSRIEEEGTPLLCHPNGAFIAIAELVETVKHET